VPIFKNDEQIYYIHWDFKEFFIMVDDHQNVITTSTFRNATDLKGRSMAVKTLRTLNTLKAEEKGHADTAKLEDLIELEKQSSDDAEGGHFDDPLGPLD